MKKLIRKVENVENFVNRFKKFCELDTTDVKKKYILFDGELCEMFGLRKEMNINHRESCRDTHIIVFCSDDFEHKITFTCSVTDMVCMIESEKPYLSFEPLHWSDLYKIHYKNN